MPSEKQDPKDIIRLEWSIEKEALGNFTFVNSSVIWSQF